MGSEETLRDGDTTTVTGTMADLVPPDPPDAGGAVATTTTAATPSSAATATLKKGGGPFESEGSGLSATYSAEDAMRDGKGKLPSVDADAFLAALKYVLRACPKESDEPTVAYVVVSSDDDSDRLVLAARDGRRWHLAFVPAPKNLFVDTIAITRECAIGARKDLDHAVKRSGSAKVVFDPLSKLLWHVRYGAPTPLTIALQEFQPGVVPEGWRPPRFIAPPFSGALVAAIYASKSTTEARSWPGGAEERRDEVDIAGRRHVVLTDSAGQDLARAVVVPLGQTDGLPKPPQEEIPGTLSPKASKGGAASAFEPGIPAGPALTVDAMGYWRVERRSNVTNTWGTKERGTEEECRAFLEKAPGDAAHRLLRPDGTVAQYLEGAPVKAPKAGKVTPKRSRAKGAAAAPAASKKPAAPSPKRGAGPARKSAKKGGGRRG